MADAHDIVILGASFAGSNIAHAILRNIIPAITSKVPNAPTYKVHLISSSTHFFWVVGSPRALVSADLVPLDKSFFPIADGFRDYPPERFSFVHGTVQNVDTERRKISVRSSATSRQDLISYDTLIIATGASSVSPLWSVKEGHEKTRNAFSDMHARLPSAKSILIAGGGPAGTETAGELASQFGTSKDITILSGSERLLGQARPAMGQNAEKYLKNMGVTVIHGKRVTASESTGSGQTRVQLIDGTSSTVDIYIDATGLYPNTQFMTTGLSSTGSIITDPHTMRVPSAGPRVYAIGPCASHSNGTILELWDSIPPFLSILEYDLSDGRSGKEVQYKKNQTEMMVVPVGRSKGVGVAFGWTLPSFMVWVFKGRTFMYEQAPGIVKGTKYSKA
ncbi:MAG: hypothetical protein M1817_005572 [Caeruleum heppii]|nr:MAG: hypothetical protein M1817_005572 [Caeruleum heppii]